ncbi:hypothetical protein DU502_11060 [Haloplanus aerogenes]|uniref:Uncharacterized protein n=1 Tax=Haloplanus aerogenes TaxID=660522 RepID=A0A3G8QWP3_9EURY|nr:hypothetical protein DU502_11060 [Haloplanus aerogenes]
MGAGSGVSAGRRRLPDRRRRRDRRRDGRRAPRLPRSVGVPVGPVRVAPRNCVITPATRSAPREGGRRG